MMIKRTCDRCGMVMGPKSSISNVHDNALDVKLFRRYAGILDVDLCSLCEDDVYEFIFHKKKPTEDGEE